MFVNEEAELTFVLGVGETASLDCQAAGAPSPNVTWTVPSDSQLSRQGLPLSAPMLDVHLQDGADAGDYTCVAQNDVGSITRTFTVKVASKCFF